MSDLNPIYEYILPNLIRPNNKHICYINRDRLIFYSKCVRKKSKENANNLLCTRFFRIQTHTHTYLSAWPKSGTCMNMKENITLQVYLLKSRGTI